VAHDDGFRWVYLGAMVSLCAATIFRTATFMLISYLVDSGLGVQVV